MSTSVPKDPAFRARIQASFDRQGLMGTLGASILHVAPGAVDIALPAGPAVSQQHGFVHAGAVAAIILIAGQSNQLKLTPDDGRDVNTLVDQLHQLVDDNTR